MTVSKRVVYSGRVQGVGFRYTARELSRDFEICGTVRNRADGSVELVAQGQADEVDGFLSAIAARMRGYISKQTVEEMAAGNFQGFQIIP